MEPHSYQYEVTFPLKPGETEQDAAHAAMKGTFLNKYVTSKGQIPNTVLVTITGDYDIHSIVARVASKTGGIMKEIKLEPELEAPIQLSESPKRHGRSSPRVDSRERMGDNKWAS